MRFLMKLPQTVTFFFNYSCQFSVRHLLSVTESVISHTWSTFKQIAEFSHCGALSWFVYCAAEFASCLTCTYSLTHTHPILLISFFSSVPVVKTW